jgi:predicted MFS family arabinose efflux permease
MALYLAVFMGGTPVGAPLIGWVGEAWGPRWTLWLGGGITAVGAIVAHLLLGRPGARRAVPPVAEDLAVPAGTR